MFEKGVLVTPETRVPPAQWKLSWTIAQGCEGSHYAKVLSATYISFEIRNHETPTTIICGSEEEPTETRQQTMSSEKANDYIRFLQQFLSLGRYEKKRYLKFRAPDHFICILRECVRNVKRGVIQCDKALIDACNSSYSCGRIDENSANHSEARNLFCTNKTMVIVSQLLPTVITHLQSFTRNI